MTGRDGESASAAAPVDQRSLRAWAWRGPSIIWRCWYDRQPYDEARYLLALQKRHSPIPFHAAQSP